MSTVTWTRSVDFLFFRRERSRIPSRDAHVRTLPKRYQDLTPDELDDLWAADLVLAMTDNFEVQSLINADALAVGGLGGSRCLLQRHLSRLRGDAADR